MRVTGGIAHELRFAGVLLVAASTLAAVFLLPWYVPVSVNTVISDSQAVGFNNRVSMVALALGVVTMLLLAMRWGRRAGEPIIGVESSPRDRVNPWLLRAAIAVAVIGLSAVGVFLGDHPYADALYFANVFLRVQAGGVPFSEIEFAYGPLLFYLPYATWLALKWTGVSIYAVYYAWVIAFQAAGLAATAFLLNRIRLTRSLRNGAFVFVAVVAVCQPTLSLGYSIIRYLVAYVLFIWVMERLSDAPGRWQTRVLPLLAVALAAGVSPEMGVTLLVALCVSLGYLTLRVSRTHAPSFAVLLGGVTLLALVVLLLNGPGTIAGFAGGAFYLPVLPSAAAILFVIGALVLGWGVGSVAHSSPGEVAAVHLGWLALALVLIAPALGRADVGHIWSNSLGVALSAAAVLGGRPLRAGLYLGVAWAVLAAGIVAGFSGHHIPVLKEKAIRSLVTSQEAGERLAVFVGSTKEAGASRWEMLSVEREADRRTAAELATVPSLAYPNFLYGELGEGLAESGDLVPLYLGHPGMAITRSDYFKLLAQMEQAEHLAIHSGEVAIYRELAMEADPDREGIVMTMPSLVGGPEAGWDLNMGFPLVFAGRNPVFDPTSSFAVWLERGWVPDRTIGDYTVFRRI